MEYKKIRDRFVPVVGQGAMGIGGYLKMDNSKDNFYINCLKKCLDYGITLFDTAEVYGMGHSEELIGKVIKKARNKVFISSKVSPEHLSYMDVINSAESSLKRLQTDYIDLYQIHWPNNKIPIEETMGALEKLRKDGKIKYIGVSNFSLIDLKDVEEKCPGLVCSVQLEYNLMERTVEETILSHCEQNNIILIAYSPLNQGDITGSKRKNKIIEKIAQQYEKTVSQISLNWLVCHKPVIVIPASTNIEHIKQNAESFDFSLTEDDVGKISRIYRREKIYVYPEKIRVQNGGKGDRKVYTTKKQAIRNEFGFIPSPIELAEQIRYDRFANPVKVKSIEDKTGMYDYDLVEGRIRYWAWVIAYNWEKPILVNISNGQL